MMVRILKFMPNYIFFFRINFFFQIGYEKSTCDDIEIFKNTEYKCRIEIDGPLQLEEHVELFYHLCFFHNLIYERIANFNYTYSCK